MEKKPYGCLTLYGLISVGLTVLIVVVVGVVRNSELFSPGSLSAQTSATFPSLGGVTSHADLSNRCSACHTAFWQPVTMAERCIACHTDIATQQQDPATLHGNLAKSNFGVTCRTCHPDHRGPSASLTDMTRVNLSHQAFGYALSAHQKQADGSAFTCGACHGSDYIKFDQTICTTCHQQIKATFMQAHLQAYGTVCLGCHDGVDSYGHAFDHSKAPFPLTGKHASVVCASCHTGARTITDMKDTPRGCYACHAKDDKHQGQFGQNCGACHSTDGWLPATFDHSKTKFPLTGGHAGLACSKCHINNVFTGLSTACAACHPDPAFHTGLFPGMACDQCHTTTAWTPASFNQPHPNGNCGDQNCVNHQRATCQDCHPTNLTTFTCLKCHDSNTPGDGGRGGGG
jgi:predicted CXXCH cytochrome family protein